MNLIDELILIHNKIQPKTVDLSARLLGINTESVEFICQEPRSEVYCVRLNFNISKFVYHSLVIVNNQW